MNDIPDSINGISSDSVITIYLLTLWGYPASLCQLELDKCQHGATPEPADLKPYILFIAGEYQRGCSKEFLQHSAALLQHTGLQQAILQLPQPG
ncbi:hypothetical protein [Rheinheimera sp. F8]|uniref:hypothetical protein n=1 Tax=Rheinheimera sp. F8 TaxID=1763998 RepID=UPI000744A9B8|nr:hypothetical protein [Rheinheimera sp. F8]ALZ76670.1 hypothetical protein ATY27_13495 [Rheinheimera sp. F8]